MPPRSTPPGGQAPAGAPTPPSASTPHKKTTKEDAKRALKEIQVGYREHSRDALAPSMKELRLYQRAKIKKDEKKLAEMQEQYRQEANRLWAELHKKVEDKRRGGFESFNEFATIVMKMVTTGLELADALHASLASRAPNFYPRTFKEGFIKALQLPYRLAKFASAPLAGLALLGPGALALTPLMGASLLPTLGKEGFLRAKERLWDFKGGMKNLVKGKIELSMDDKGMLISNFKIHGQNVKDRDFMSSFNTLVYGYLETKNYDIDTSSPDGPKVVYGKEHPDVKSRKQQKGDVIASADFKDLIKDDYEGLREFIGDIAQNRPTNLPKP